MLDTDIQELASLTTREGDLDNFERLFSKLKEMKGNVPGSKLCHLFQSLTGMRASVGAGETAQIPLLLSEVV